ncbi:PREDICTED: uncharacterized protein LOC101296725 [Fragaria vesca subsp. vesca]|uniref:uncharacterized protein LOC101296725 n=1 Tax=Fragaria vesca subsp. vesca TaxID=101020 RepID=UPI0002C321ED|nr:PREDICTED: uncharacterized protein LOC101296725 [Fragaria vesca subsp. vesca]
MNTKTMRLPPRRISTTIASSNNNAPKRKERESLLDAPHNPAKTLKLSHQAEPPGSSALASGHLLAGYLAHEFLTKGTLLGQLWDPTARSAAEEPPVEKSPDRREAEAEPQYEKLERYVEVADLLKTDGAQLAGIVNPTQLARFLQL